LNVDVGLLPAALKAAIAATAIRAAISPYSIAVAPEINTAEYYRERAVACEKSQPPRLPTSIGSARSKWLGSWRELADYRARMLVGRMLVGDKP
jgi:hypothetical protein